MPNKNNPHVPPASFSLSVNSRVSSFLETGFVWYLSRFESVGSSGEGTRSGVDTGGLAVMMSRGWVSTLSAAKGSPGKAGSLIRLCFEKHHHAFRHNIFNPCLGSFDDQISSNETNQSCQWKIKQCLCFELGCVSWFHSCLHLLFLHGLLSFDPEVENVHT